MPPRDRPSIRKVATSGPLAQFGHRRPSALDGHLKLDKQTAAAQKQEKSRNGATAQTKRRFNRRNPDPARDSLPTAHSLPAFGTGAEPAAARDFRAAVSV